MKKIEPIGTRISKWGEGPVWLENSLYYVDIKGHSVCRLDPQTGEENDWNVGEEVGFVVPCASGKLLCGGDNGFFTLDKDDGSITRIADPEPNLPNNRFNDGKCSPDGRLFAGTIATDKTTGAARLYRMDFDLSWKEVFGPVTNSNGLAWTKDGKTLYYIDSPSKEVKRFDYDANTGGIIGGNAVLDLADELGIPDGMTIDKEDQLWIAFCHGGRVARFDPKTGRETDRIEIPAHETTSCTFGGPTGQDLYITTGIYLKDEEDQGGRVFVVKGLPVGGNTVTLFKDA